MKRFDQASDQWKQSRQTSEASEDFGSLLVLVVWLFAQRENIAANRL